MRKSTMQASDDRSQGGRKFMGLLSKAPKNKDSNADMSHHRRATDDFDITHSPLRRQADFLPNPEIPPSPGSNSSDKKIWEGAYHNFLSGKGSSPDSVDPPTKIQTKKSSFSVIPGTRRLVAPRSGLYGGSSRGPQSMPVLDGGNGENTQEVRTGSSLLRGMFNRSTSDGSVSVSRRSRNYSSGSDDLDSVMRNGMNKHSPEYSNMPRKHHSMSMAPTVPILRTSSHDDVPSGLDALLAAGSSGSPHYTVETAGVSRVRSYGSMPPMMAESAENSHNNYPYYLPKRDSTSSFNYHQAGLNLDEDSFNSSTSSEPLHSRSKSADFSAKQDHSQTQPPLHSGGIGGLLNQQGSVHVETDLHQYRNNPQHLQNQSLYGGRNISHPITNQRNGTLINDVSPPMDCGVGSALQLGDSSQSVGSTLSNSINSKNEHQYGTPPSIDPQQKKVFTAFHNQARFARDATSAFLGSDAASPIHHDGYRVHHAMVAPSGFSIPFQAHSAIDLRSMGVAFSTSLPPLETVDENHISIHKSMRMLKPVTGTESWETGRRYLIAPAALAACPLSVITRLSGSLVQSAKEAVESTTSQPFGSINLGDCLMTYVGDTHHLSLGQWSACKLVLRQNYLLEFDTSAPINGIPRGYVHLQHAQAKIHSDFQNSLVLDFYASPCAKADRRTLMIRTDTREECTYWVGCLNKASQLTIEDLWDFSGNIEFGRGRYAAVYPARRKTKEYYAATCGEKETNGASESAREMVETLVKYDCALKIIEKTEFWRRVVKGRERADTLVRETSVQAALTARCGGLGTFLQLRGLFETSENVVMELELLEGTDLFNHVSSRGSLSENEAATIMRDVLLCLDAMNRVGVAHRDIKAANILMCDKAKDGVSIKVGDFGMSTFVAVDGLVRGRCGTPGFVAPEILLGGSGKGYSNEVDMFSAGVTLYVMLCGYEPFYGKDEKELIESNRRAKIEFPEDDWGRISNDARDLVLKMTHADPQQRISAKEALKHPWIGLCDDVNPSGLTESRRNALSASEVPEEGACIIS